MKKQTHFKFFSIKIIKSTFLCIFLVFGISLNSQSQIISTIESKSGCIGDTLSIMITVSNFIDVDNITTDIYCDPAVLSYIGVQNINPELSGGMLLIFQVGSSIKSSWINPVDSATILNGVLYELIFIYGGGSFWLHGSGDYGGITTYWIDGYVHPSSLSISGKVTYDDDLSTHQPISNTLLKLYDSNGTLIDSTFTNHNGDYYFFNICNGIYYIETNCTKPWGGGNALDALIDLYHYSGLYTLTGLRWQAGDVDGSNFVSTLDALYIMQRFALVINSFPVGDWVFENDTITVNGANVVHNFKGLCVGDVDGSYKLP